MLTLGVIATSRKENEHRLPLHPAHLDRIPDELAAGIRLERGYGESFGVPDRTLAERFAFAERDELLAHCDAVLLPKPMPEDLRELHEGGILWGWPHCVQQREITQAAIDRRLTLLAWEAMFNWRGEVRETHAFYRNNEMAGYCGVIHALGLAGQDALYGPPLSAVVLSHGSVSRGAIHALLARGFSDVRVYTQREPWSVHDRIPGCRYGRMLGGDPVGVVDADGASRALAEVLAGADVIVNGILQDTDRPLMFLRDGEEQRLRPGSLIVDVSCDLAMGFPFARPTSFGEPTFEAGPATYYAVDHTPSYLWRAATWELSEVVLAFLPAVMAGPEAWRDDPTLRRAVEIAGGVICNDKILRFQQREEGYPHRIAS